MLANTHQTVACGVWWHRTTGLKARSYSGVHQCLSVVRMLSAVSYDSRMTQTAGRTDTHRAAFLTHPSDQLLRTSRTRNWTNGHMRVNTSRCAQAATCTRGDTPWFLCPRHARLLMGVFINSGWEAADSVCQSHLHSVTYQTHSHPPSLQ